jgi:nitrogen regulatory protein PII-like uncharacterized protein
LDKKKVFIICLFAFTVDISAVEIEKSSIVPGSYGIQVGAFKNVSNIQKIKDDLYDYELYLESYKGLKRIQVVNLLTSEDFKHTLAIIKKKYPNAFVLKRARVSKKSVDKIENSNNYRQIIKPKSINIQSFEQYLPTLDSNSILKTRKSFL